MNALAVIERAPVAWHDLSAVPDDRRDGRDVLLWRGCLVVASWCDGWRDPVGRPVIGATHYADAEGPVS